MSLSLLIAFALYCTLLAFICFLALKKNKNAADYTLGNRSLNYWVTALAAQASDMGVWLFMGFPATVYATGISGAWIAIGLTFFMGLSWLFVAPKLRIATEKYDSVTLPTFFEKRFNDPSGMLRITSALFCLLFFMFYIAASFVALGYLFNDVFGISYLAGISIGSCVVFYILLGGFLSLAWIDTFQGFFLLMMLILVASTALSHCGGIPALTAAAHHGASDSLFKSLENAIGWGLGYFGMPHVITKFMGIRDVRNMKKAMVVGLVWQIVALSAAVCIGLIGTLYFTQGLENNDLIFVILTKSFFNPFFAGIILCAIIATTINNMGALVLSCTSVLAEDFYSRFAGKKVIQKLSVQNASRLGVLIICASAFVFALCNEGKGINSLVYYAWAGLGSSFGPLILVSLHTKMTNRYAALAGILGGGLTAGLLPYITTDILAMIPAFIVSLLCMGIVRGTFKNEVQRPQFQR